jgi:hypothetical protein
VDRRDLLGPEREVRELLVLGCDGGEAAHRSTKAESARVEGDDVDIRGHGSFNERLARLLCALVALVGISTAAALRPVH